MRSGTPTFPLTQKQRSILGDVAIADKLSTTPYIPQIPGSLGSSILQSPAEMKYKRAREEALRHKYPKLASHVAIRAAVRFEKDGLHERGFPWAKISGDETTLRRVGAKAARTKEAAALAAKNSFFANEIALNHYRKGVYYASESKNPELTTEMRLGAAKRLDSYGDLLVGKPGLSIIGLAFGYSRGARIAKGSDPVLAASIHQKAVERYKDDYLAVNPLTLAVSTFIIGDSVQSEIMRGVLENRLQKQNAKSN